MRMPAAQAGAVLFVLADRWARERDLLTLLGAENPSRLEDAIAEVGTAPLAGTADAASRAARIKAALDQGGEVMGADGQEDR